MRAEFDRIADHLERSVVADEVALASFEGEESDFVRFNHGKVRQAGTVRQRELSVTLIRGARHASAELSLSGLVETDLARIDEALDAARAQLEVLPDDPHLAYATEVRSSDVVRPDRLPGGTEATARIVEAAAGLDLVGILALGPIHAGFANSLGQRNWFTSASFHLDFSVYAHGDKAVKSSYAGFEFDPSALRARVEAAREDLARVALPPKTVEPGRYRAYLAPAAVGELLTLLAWDAFGLKSHRSKQSSLLRLVDGDARFHPSLHLAENHEDGVGPNFQAEGFRKPARVPLIEAGAHAGALVSPRSAREYGVETNGASAGEQPEALELAAGVLPSAEILRALDTGLYVNNLWYTNYSDRAACRITGMTRFATFWVEGGEVKGPVDVMRFDDSLYRMLGDHLEGLTAERELMLDGDTYGGRSTGSMRLPGALLSELRFTL